MKARPIIVPSGSFDRTAAVAIYNAMADAYAASAERIRRRGVRQLESFGVGLPGDPAMDAVYDRLAALTNEDHCYPWYAVHPWLTEERWVSREHPESTFGRVFDRLVRPTALDHRNIRRIQVGSGPPDAVAAWYAAGLQPLDVLVLVLGAAGQIAGLYPGSPALRERTKAAVVTAPSGTNPCITITPPVIAEATRVIVLARGAAVSLHALNALRGNTSIEQTPARLARSATWVLDEPAAMMLGDP